jgi:transposase
LVLRNRAVIVLAYLKKISKIEIAQFLGISLAQVNYILDLYNKYGTHKLFGKERKGRERKHENTECKNNLFALLHSPPRDHDINRTTWTLRTLSAVSKKQGFLIGIGTISKIIKDAGFKFRHSKKVLTSTDPNYKIKLHEITKVLSCLSLDEKFFSVDEYGPFSIKKKGGISLVKQDQLRIIPQYQKSKGSVIATAALELSENQITHFFSQNKNSDEMMKLIQILILKYSDQSRLYISWDAASWHISNKVKKWLDQINTEEYRLKNKSPSVALMPLPSCAQFLNVIESVFSGMAKAIIHNSDYQSVEECYAAIDRYFLERNDHFKACPNRAGNKIWGMERVPSKFSESNNCKDTFIPHRRTDT